jgi:hypothetical protein
MYAYTRKIFGFILDNLWMTRLNILIIIKEKCESKWELCTKDGKLNGMDIITLVYQENSMMNT